LAKKYMSEVIRFPVERVPYSVTPRYREKSADIVVLPLIRMGWLAKVEPSFDFAHEREAPESRV
jgi:hypothetical protein